MLTFQHMFWHVNSHTTYLLITFYISLLFFIEIFDVMSEGQQFEFLGFTLNPVIRMAIMRKVWVIVQKLEWAEKFLSFLSFPIAIAFASFIIVKRVNLMCVYDMLLMLTNTRISRKPTEWIPFYLFYCYATSRTEKRKKE